MTRDAIEGRLLKGASGEFQRAIRHATPTPANASGAIALGASLAVDAAVRTPREDVVARTLDVLVRTEQAWGLARTAEAVARG